MAAITLPQHKRRRHLDSGRRIWDAPCPPRPYAANILGVYRSTDGGESWAPFDQGLPNSFISDLDIRKHDRTLYASTMGRGVYRRRL